MHVFGAFELAIQPGTPDNMAPVRIALLRYTRGEDGRLYMTPECSSYEEVEGQINSLQDELDEIRERARRAFQVTGNCCVFGHIVPTGWVDSLGVAFGEAES
jgi:hypothetical protein